MHNFLVFLGSVFQLQFVLLGGCVLTVLVGIIERIKNKSVTWKAYLRIIGVLMLFACYQA